MLFLVSIASMVVELVAGKLVGQADTSTPFCSGKPSGLYKPYEGTVVWQNTTGRQCNEIEVLYCSNQHGDKRSVGLDLWLSERKDESCTTTGLEILRDVKPRGEDADDNDNSYRYKTLICPFIDHYPQGEWVLTAYEYYTGNKVPDGYLLSTVDLNMKTL
ncbi:hypothetical protein K470DRAFT_257599 [Piedraia hortae CBS 480.64]|uniref:Uncharacterized protein n=1 Tax=Piedraia hortae CBS 480.64 TaxID=1314780 RepID=A0A6A7C038_9PEZI|nr:hypothetical protein K470DRAFT_257599 [Piedraia hortae CBS 480.64]